MPRTSTTTTTLAHPHERGSWHIPTRHRTTSRVRRNQTFTVRHQNFQPPQRRQRPIRQMSPQLRLTQPCLQRQLQPLHPMPVHPPPQRPPRHPRSSRSRQHLTRRHRQRPTVTTQQPQHLPRCRFHPPPANTTNRTHRRPKTHNDRQQASHPQHGPPRQPLQQHERRHHDATNAARGTHQDSFNTLHDVQPRQQRTGNQNSPTYTVSAASPLTLTTATTHHPWCTTRSPEITHPWLELPPARPLQWTGCQHVREPRRGQWF